MSNDVETTAETVRRVIEVLVRKTLHSNVTMAMLYIFDGSNDHDRINETAVGNMIHQLSLNMNLFCDTLLAHEGIVLDHNDRGVLRKICTMATCKDNINQVGFDPFTHKCIGEYVVRMIK